LQKILQIVVALLAVASARVSSKSELDTITGAKIG
jgi:hypothetical protein